MSTLALEIDRELQTLEPETAQHFERAVREMLMLVKRRSQPVSSNGPSLSPRPYETQARALGLRPGLSYDQVGELLVAGEGEDWK